MILGSHTFGFAWHTTPEAAFDALGAMGIGQVQLMATAPHFDPWLLDVPRTRRLLACLERNGQTPLALDLASSDVNLCSANPEVVAFARESYARAIARAAELGMPWVCIGSGRRHPLLPAVNAQLRDPLRRVFADLHREAARQGVKLILENHPHGLLPSADDMASFIEGEGYTDVTVIYDVANASFIGEDPVAGLARLGGLTRIVHLSDAKTGVWGHDPIGSGDIDFPAIGQKLAAMGYDSHVVLEIMGEHPARDTAAGVAKLRQMGFGFA